MNPELIIGYSFTLEYPRATTEFKHTREHAIRGINAGEATPPRGWAGQRSSLRRGCGYAGIPSYSVHTLWYPLL